MIGNERGDFRQIARKIEKQQLKMEPFCPNDHTLIGCLLLQYGFRLIDTFKVTSFTVFGMRTIFRM